MTEEQRNNIKKDIHRLVPIIARNNQVYDDDVESILIDDYIDEDDFIVVPWPEVQELMVKDDFHLNSSLATDEWCIDKYGSSAYFVNKKWLNNLS